MWSFREAASLLKETHVIEVLAYSGSLFSARTFGLAVLIAIAAIVLGYVVRMFWPKQHNPQLFAVLAAAALVGGLAFAGNTAAMLAILLMIAIAALMAFAGML